MESFPKEFLAEIHTFVHTLIKETLKGSPPFLCSEFSGVHCINPTDIFYVADVFYKAYEDIAKAPIFYFLC